MPHSVYMSCWSFAISSPRSFANDSRRPTSRMMPLSSISHRTSISGISMSWKSSDSPPAESLPSSSLMFSRLRQQSSLSNLVRAELSIHSAIIVSAYGCRGPIPCPWSSFISALRSWPMILKRPSCDFRTSVTSASPGSTSMHSVPSGERDRTDGLSGSMERASSAPSGRAPSITPRALASMLSCRTETSSGSALCSGSGG